MHTSYNICKLVRRAGRSCLSLVSIATALSMGSIVASCGDFLEEYSQDLARVRTVDDLNELVVGDCLLSLGSIYTANSNWYTQNPNYLMLHMMGDELQENLSTPDAPEGFRVIQTYFPYFTWQRDLNLDEEGKNSYESTETWYWDEAYAKIGACNMVIDAASTMDVTNDDDQAKLNQVMGDAHYLRATYYLMLVNLYADAYTSTTASTTPGVPMKTTSNVEDVEYARASVAEVYAQIDADLVLAEQYLAGITTQQSIYHASYAAALVVHSRVKLYMQQWAEAAEYARQAIAANGHLTDLRGWNSGYPLSSSNDEVLFSNGASVLGNEIFMAPGRTSSYYNYGPIYIIDPHLVALYSEGDGRLSAYITNRDDAVSGQWTYKKIDNSRANYSTIKTVSDVFAVRTAEAYLNLAEALAHIGDDGGACQALGQLRSHRIAGDAAVSLSGQQLVQTIREERERELCLEGHRWFDLRRYATDVQYPFAKTIEHTFSTYVYRNYMDMRTTIAHYRLEPGDAAYTLNIPKTVRDFQPSIGSNSRPDRAPYATTVTEDDDSDDDYDYDW